MKNEIKTIIIGIALTILIIFLVLFIFYKVDQNKENKSVKSLTSKNEVKEVNNPSNQNNTAAPTISTKENTNDEVINKVTVYMFHSNGCGACVNAMKKLNENKNTTYQNIEIKTYEISSNDNHKLLNKVAQKLNVDKIRIPFFVIGNSNIIGLNEEKILNEYKSATKDPNYKDIVEETINENKDLKIKMESIK